MFTEKYENINQSNYTIHAIEHSKFNLNSTLFLAYRDINILLKKHLIDRAEKPKYRLLDYGCGTGLSTYVYSETLARMGYDVEIFGVDVNIENLSIAKNNVPNANFIHIKNIDEIISEEPFDLIICNFVLLELSYDHIPNVLKKLKTLISDDGILVSTNASRQSYNCNNHWYTLNNNYPQNLPKNTTNNKIDDGQKVSLAVRDPVSGNELFRFHDFFYTNKTYANVFRKSGFNIIETYKPLGKDNDGIPWLSEKDVSPYRIQIFYPDNNSYNHLLTMGNI